MTEIRNNPEQHNSQESELRPDSEKTEMDSEDFERAVKWANFLSSEAYPYSYRDRLRFLDSARKNDKFDVDWERLNRRAD